MSREYPAQPVVGVGAVVWRDGKVLLVRRGKPPRAGHWSLPGGRLELGETVSEAARREVFEETGLTVDVLGLVTTVDLIERDDDGRVRFHYVLVDVSAAWLAGDAVAGDDAAETAWVTLEDLATMDVWSETERVIRLAAAQRAL